MKNINLFSELVEQPEKISHYKKIAWPLYSWPVIMDSTVVNDLDPLQELVLQLICSKKYVRYELGSVLGLSQEVLVAVEEKCMNDGYLESLQELTESGTKIVGSKGYFTADYNKAETGQKVMLFRDGLSGDIVPYFDHEGIGRLYESSCDIQIEANSKFRDMPNYTQLNHALKTRKKIKQFCEDFEKAYKIEAGPEVYEALVDGFDEDDEDDEVNWVEQAEAGLRMNQVVTPQEAKDKKEKSNVNDTVMDEIFLWTSNPQQIYGETYIYIHPDDIENIKIKSPFGSQLDGWFLNKFKRACISNQELQLEVELLFEEVREKFIDSYAFNNEEAIVLFDRIPRLANYDIFQNIRKEIVVVYRAYKRIQDGDDDYDTFFTRCQRALEGFLGYIVDQMPRKKFYCDRVHVDGFRDQITRISNELDIRLPDNLKHQSIGKNIKHLKGKNSGALKDRSVMFLLEAYYEKDHRFKDVCCELPDFYEKINTISNVRNEHAHYGSINLTRKEYLTKVDLVKTEFEAIITVLFNKYI